EIVKTLLNAKADPNGGTIDAPLLSAIYEKNVASAELLLQAGANPNAEGKVDWDVDWGVIKNGTMYYGNSGPSETPLFLAIQTKQFPIVQLLLKYNADPNDSQTDGKPVVFNALDDTNILSVLLDAGGNANSRTPDGFPLLDRAVVATNVTDVQLLLQHGADANVRIEHQGSSANGYTPLHYAAEQLADPKIFELLFEHHADPNVRGDDGKTPLDLLKEKMGGISSANVNGFGVAVRTIYVSPDQQKNQTTATQLAYLLRQHGALDNLPDWNSIKVSRPAANFTTRAFQKGTNDWNHFTLLELILKLCYNYPDPADSRNLQFPDFAHIAVIRPNASSAESKHISIDLLNSNSVDCTKDMLLEFGDTVEIPEREHTLADKDYWTQDQIKKIIWFLRDHAGEAKLVVAGGQTIQLPLNYFEPVDCRVGEVLKSPMAQNVLRSDSDLSRVKVTRCDPKTGKKSEWILNCAGQSTATTEATTFRMRLQQITMQLASQPPNDLWLRDGDVIDVPEKP
ncbi:MAG TPA: ankyrin repeat domain-containing protein, partial [Verrucomicrobiae bacterium]|nr:ankyrin repeat domain-containing protein [Verrucomicrobiae bacterium]